MIYSGDYGLGRLEAVDPRDVRFPLSRVLQATPPDEAEERGWRYWNPSAWWGNQGNTSQCVAYAWMHYIEDGPVTHSITPHGSPHPLFLPHDLYRLCQDNDEWIGNDYNGTSVRAGAKVLQSLGMITSYLWTWSMNEMIRTLLRVGPVVVGTAWHSGMFYPDDEGFISPTGPVKGGHAYLANGVNEREEKIRFKNSWGRGWGDDGHFWMRYEDAEKVLHNGEICLAVETESKE